MVYYCFTQSIYDIKEKYACVFSENLRLALICCTPFLQIGACSNQ